MLSDKIKLILAYAVVGTLAVLGTLYAPSAEMKAACSGIAVAVAATFRSLLDQKPASAKNPKGPPPIIPGAMSMVWFTLAAVGAITAIAGQWAILLSACEFQKRPIVQETEVDLIACVLTAGTDDPVALIAKCGPKVAPLIPEILRLKHSAQAKGFKLCATCDAASDAGDQ
jgi:hypothetical protein